MILKALYTNTKTQYNVSNSVTALFLTVFSFIAWFFPEVAEVLLVKDFPGGAGAVEQFTELFLFLGLLLAVPVFFKYRRNIPDRILQTWFVLWLLGTFYFLGEEVSWGQWWFGWDTPEAWAEINRQDETNIHNISSWFSEKPRLMLELFIYSGGFLIPLFYPKVEKRLELKAPLATWVKWAVPAPACIAPAAFLLFTRLLRLFFVDYRVLEFFADGEFREMLIAWFILWYLLGLCQKAIPPDEEPTPVTT
jgi:hypothetical protein